MNEKIIKKELKEKFIENPTTIAQLRVWSKNIIKPLIEKVMYLENKIEKLEQQLKNKRGI